MCHNLQSIIHECITKIHHVEVPTLYYIKLYLVLLKCIDVQ